MARYSSYRISENLRTKRLLRGRCRYQSAPFLFPGGLRLKDPIQSPPFSLPSKLLMLHGDVKSFCFAVSCLPESLCNFP